MPFSLKRTYTIYRMRRINYDHTCNFVVQLSTLETMSWIRELKVRIFIGLRNLLIFTSVYIFSMLQCITEGYQHNLITTLTSIQHIVILLILPVSMTFEVSSYAMLLLHYVGIFVRYNNPWIWYLYMLLYC